MNCCITVLQTAPLPLGYAAIEKIKYVLEKINQVKPQTGTIHGEPARVKSQKIVCMVSAMFHGGVAPSIASVPVSHKGSLRARAIITTPLHRFPINARTDSNACLRDVGDNRLHCGPDITSFSTAWKAATVQGRHGRRRYQRHSPVSKRTPTSG